MSYVIQSSLPQWEPVSVSDAKCFLRLPQNYTEEDDFIFGLIQAAREQGETITGRALAQRTFTQVMDSFPYYTDTIQSQLAYPANYYSLPRYSTTLWNYSQMIKLYYPPVISVQNMTYIDGDGNPQVLMQDYDFILDNTTQMSRIFPIPGTYWPASFYVANSLEVNFTAGYNADPTIVTTHTVVDDPDFSEDVFDWGAFQTGGPPQQQPVTTLVTGVPQVIRIGILNLVAYWFQNRGDLSTVSDNIYNIFRTQAIYDFAGMRG